MPEPATRQTAVEAVTIVADQTRDQAEAFLETLRRRSWADGDPLSDQALAEHVAAFQGDHDG